MAKIMLVEDDKSLREIYSIRLVAEGYDVVSAGDGEEALAMAVQEKPDLILSDVMMPKISGFDMLDILRSTPETKDIKVIMMTALSSEDQRQRGENLGANKYLVKSQVGIEDVINAVHEVMGDKNTTAEASSASSDAMLAQRTDSTPHSASPDSLNPSSAEVSSMPTETPAPTPVETPAPAPVAPQPSEAEMKMEAVLNEDAGAQAQQWPGTATNQ
ncbi:response regulator [Candidatus Saccharibacteria bacterium]|nr:response regulator [Candidatus Saccharibacteria bacterium]